jgi:uncharacterized repeat protein (TIGR03803 family)
MSAKSYCRSRPFSQTAMALAVAVFTLALPSLMQAQTESVLYSYPAGGIGNPSFPIACSFDHAGNLYVVTQEGGAGNAGSVSQLKPVTGGWDETTIYSFTGETDGALPWNAVVADAAGNLYGISSNGTSGGGAVYELSPTTGGTWTISILHGFTDGTDGGQPVGGMVMDSDGNLYGTAEYGGTTINGVIFELQKTGSGFTYSVLHNFPGGAGGSAPYGTLAIDAAGNLYGTTSTGGTSRACSTGCGTVFRLSPVAGGGWHFGVIHSFDGSDGAIPWAGVTLGPGGTLFGTTTYGGASGYGSLYRLAQSGGTYVITVIHSFTNGTDGGNPTAGVALDSRGNIYGAAYNGGANSAGVVYEFDHGSITENILWAFDTTDGASPHGSMAMDSFGNLYGTTFYGGTFASGTAFEVTP